MSRLLAVAVALGSLSACVAEPDPPPPPDWASEVAPIVARRCAGCHQPGGLAPDPITTWADLHAIRIDAEAAISAGRMPPWLPSSDCRELAEPLALEANERRTLLAWLRAGAPADDVASPAPLPADEIRLQQPMTDYDFEITMAEAYLPAPPEGAYDDFRCFLLDWPAAETVFVNGVDVVPGNPRLLHHVVVYKVDAEAAAALAARDAEDEGPGWSCYGGIGESPEGLLGGWQPGLRPDHIPRDRGRDVEPGGAVVLHMHYNTVRILDEGGLAPAHGTVEDHHVEPDRTSLRVRLAPGGLPLIGGAVADPGWLLPRGMPIEAGDPAATFEFQYPPSMLYAGLPLVLYDMSVHMHVLGKAARVELRRADGSSECLLDIPDWDFAWGGLYAFAKPVRIEQDDELFIRCVFDNSATNQPVIDGRRLPPRDLVWGGEFPNEMCAGIFTGSLGF